MKAQGEVESSQNNGNKKDLGIKKVSTTMNTNVMQPSSQTINPTSSMQKK